ncbi:vacuolar protein sorting protein [Pseudozyma hubeiensis SY62]|uniref:Vacuolar protein sorting protein n=1 Tax=Pseudozyma hubeiensis (strain SY62) TaxID=1305764 RepID=R9P464_PSEHS|nr:vacuolar protein sorting protein [Pseudozyma hubeiensis SY62]GAC92855.1 vacuolar protein sorting protein [Pseudozyma hubeiensis SY62]
MASSTVADLCLDGCERASAGAELLRRGVVVAVKDASSPVKAAEEPVCIRSLAELLEKRSAEAARCASDLSNEAAERVAFILAEASDLAVLGLRELSAEEDGEVDARRSDLSEAVELAETHRDVWEASLRGEGEACAESLWSGEGMCEELASAPSCDRLRRWGAPVDVDDTGIVVVASFKIARDAGCGRMGPDLTMLCNAEKSGESCPAAAECGI